MALKAGYKGIKEVGPGLDYDNTTGYLSLEGESSLTLDDLEDVSIEDPAAEDVLIYDPEEEEWINEDLSNTAAVQAKANKSDIAPVYLDDEAPAGGLSAGDEFYLSDGNLYRATTTISAGSAIVTSGGSANAEVADDVVTQLASKVSYDVEALNFMQLKNGAVTNNINLTINVSDGVLSVSGTATNTSTFATLISGPFPLPKGTYKLMCAEANEYYRIQLRNASIHSEIKQVRSGSAEEFTVNADIMGEIRIVVAPNASSAGAVSLTMHPMIKDYRDTSTEFAPFSQSNRLLTTNKTDTTVIGDVEDGASPSKSYAVGEHMIRGGKFCTVTSPVTTGSTWTLNTNYVEGTVADILAVQSKSATLGSNASADGISIGSFNEILIQGNIAIVNIRFAVSADITTGQSKNYFDLGITPFGGYSNRCILRKSDSPFEMASEGAYIASNGVVKFSYVPLTAGNYDLFAVLMIK